MAAYQHPARCSFLSVPTPALLPSTNLPPPAPANSAIAYSTRVFYDNIFEISPFQGVANDEKDKLWQDLYKGIPSPTPVALLSTPPIQAPS